MKTCENESEIEKFAYENLLISPEISWKRRINNRLPSFTASFRADGWKPSLVAATSVLNEHLVFSESFAPKDQSCLAIVKIRKKVNED